MMEALYWWDEAEKFKEQARQFTDAARQLEFFGLAETCEAVAIDAEDRATGG